MNIGFAIVSETIRPNSPCFVFHDVDLLPENEAIPYACGSHNFDDYKKPPPKHLSVCVNKFNYKSAFKL